MEYKIIATENYLLVVYENKISNNCDGMWVFYKGDIWKINHTNISHPNGLNGCNIILAHLPLNNAPVLEGMDLLPELTDDSIKSLFDGFDTINKRLGGNPRSHFKYFKAGYKAATKTYSEEDIRAAMMYGVHNHENVNEVTFNRFIQSLNQPAIPVGFKATMIGINKLGESNTLVFEAKKVKTIYNEQGIPVWQGEYIFI